MISLNFRQPYKLSDIITAAIEKFRANDLKFTYDGKAFNIYFKNYTESVSEDLVCYLDDETMVTDDDEEIYPEFVTEENLELFYYGETFEDVIFNALHQKADPSMSELIQCLNYYSEHDSFLDL